jgi:hypothetical protein
MLKAAVVGLAAVLAVLPMPPALVERYYSAAIYPAIQQVLTSLSNRVPFAVFDVLIGGAVAWLLLSAVRDLLGCGRRGLLRATAAVLGRTALTAAFLYLCFLVSWGFNYRRTPLFSKVVFDPSAASAARALSLAMTALERLNVLHGPAHAAIAASADADPALEQSFARTVGDLGVTGRVVTAHPKRSLVDPYFLAAGVDGMTDPFFLEVLVASGPLPVERPFVIAHEWSHLAGFADEGEANFVGWLAAVRGGPAAQYSAWLFLYSQLAGSLERAARDEVGLQLGPGPRADLRAIAARYQAQVLPVVSTAGWQVYDQYLKANRVDAGVASYAEVVRFVLGTRFDTEWTPVMIGRRPAPAPAAGPPG